MEKMVADVEAFAHFDFCSENCLPAVLVVAVAAAAAAVEARCQIVYPVPV
jgi:hypothetical protein